MKRIAWGLLALCIVLALSGCKPKGDAEAAKASPVPSQSPVIANSHDPENPVKLFTDRFNAACSSALDEADTGEAHTLLPELLTAEGHMYALQKLFYGPANLLYTSENLFDGGIYGIQHGSGSVWQTEEEVSFSCTLSAGDVITGTLLHDALEARQTIETASDVEGEPSVDRLICMGKIVQRDNGWYSCLVNGEDSMCSVLYFGGGKLVFTHDAPADLVDDDAWLNTAPEQWGGMCLLMEGDRVRLYERETIPVDEQAPVLP